MVLSTSGNRVSSTNALRPIKRRSFPAYACALADSHHRGPVHTVVLIIVVIILATAAIRALSSLSATICCDGLRGHDDGAVRLQVMQGVSTGIL